MFKYMLYICPKSDYINSLKDVAPCDNGTGGKI